MDFAPALSNESTLATEHNEEPRELPDSSLSTIFMGNRGSDKRPHPDSDGDESDDSLCSSVIVIEPANIGGIVPRSRDRESPTQGSSTNKRQRMANESEAITLDKLIVTERITNNLDANTPAIQLFIGYDYCFEISKHVLMEVPYFRTLLSGNWKPGPNRLFGDDPFAVRILLHILHHTPSKLPQSISTMQLFNLATLCDKYQVTDLVVPHVEFRNWIPPLWENGKPRGKLEKWVWVLKVFYKTPEQSLRLGVVLDMVAANMYKGDDTWILRTTRTSCRVSDIRYGYTIEPLDIILTKRRQQLWQALHATCNDIQTKQVKQSTKDFNAIGKLYVFLQDVSDEPSPFMSLVSQLKDLKGSAWRLSTKINVQTEIKKQIQNLEA